MIYRLHIDAYTPESIPMATLAKYMESFAALLGHEQAVHFYKLQGGSTQLLSQVEHEEVPKVRARLDGVRRLDAPTDVLKSFTAIDDLLANDNAVGTIFEETEEGEGAHIITFPGRDRPKPARYGPFNQDGSLDGDLVSIGGIDKTISLQLQNGEIRYTGCETTREIARKMGQHLFEPIRVHGTGRWLREEDGTWTLRRFKVRSFEVLRGGELKDVVAELRAVEGSGWREIDDPLSALEDLRKDSDELH